MTQATTAAVPAGVYSIVFLVFLVAVMYTVVRSGGWKALARDFPRPPGPLPQAVHRLAAMTVMPQRGFFQCVNLRADARGLFVSVIPILNVGHPPLLIPWAQLTRDREDRFLSTPQVHYRAGSSEIAFSRFAAAFIDAKRGEFARSAT